ncbi:MAG TPA: RimK family alpha-L-glutamate ligase [Candidatus Thalassarchaeaceae archaeon]|nr:RimK family alpha-L-glutamate ligase [Candidatus Thalassarchaeaceae archaeon]
MKAPRLCILSRGPQLYSTRRLVDEADAAGMIVEIVDPLETSLVLDDRQGQVIHQGWPLDVDAVIPRIGYSVTTEGVRVVRQFERMGVYVANGADAIMRSRDKLTASQILSQKGIPVPKTALVTSWRDVERAISRVGGVPCIVKTSQGTQGDGVYLVRSIRHAKELVYRLLAERNTILVQEYIRESHGKDIRVIVVGGKVVAAMRRVSNGREFRSNFHLGGRVESIDLPDEYAKVAIDAATHLGIEVGGVDLLEGRMGPILLEVNSSPGLEGIEKASGVNVAAHIIKMISKRHKIQSINLDEVIRGRAGFGTVTVTLNVWPQYIGRSISDILPPESFVVTIIRGKENIWSADHDLILQPNDQIILYGPIETIRAHIDGKDDPAAAMS